jgi:hypothetical protein
VCVFITAGPTTKLFAWGRGDSGGHLLRETTSRGLCGLGCPLRTSERVGRCIFASAHFWHTKPRVIAKLSQNKSHFLFQPSIGTAVIVIKTHTPGFPVLF